VRIWNLPETLFSLDSYAWKVGYFLVKASQSIKQRGFACVGVAGEGDCKLSL
jgi:hypothetical protein